MSNNDISNFIQVFFHNCNNFPSVSRNTHNTFKLFHLQNRTGVQYISILDAMRNIFEEIGKTPAESRQNSTRLSRNCSKATAKTNAFALTKAMTWRTSWISDTTTSAPKA